MTSIWIVVSCLNKKQSFFFTTRLLINGQPDLFREAPVHKTPVRKDINFTQSTTVCRDLSRKVFNPAVLFPSINYKLLDRIIEGFFTVVRTTNMFKTQGILLNGEPGLGKSRACDFLAKSNKQDLLYELLELLETNVFDHCAVFIFFSNNFQTIFDDIDVVHFNSLQTRFAPVHFTRCDKSDFNVKYFNNLIKGTYLHHTDDILNGYLSITYRAINHCHVNAGYDLIKLIDVVNNYEPEVHNPKRLSPQKIFKQPFKKELSENINDNPKKNGVEVTSKEENNDIGGGETQKIDVNVTGKEQQMNNVDSRENQNNDDKASQLFEAIKT